MAIKHQFSSVSNKNRQPMRFCLSAERQAQNGKSRTGFQWQLAAVSHD